MNRLCRRFHLFDPPLHHGENRTVELYDLFVRKFVEKCLWMNPGIEENLIRVRVADGAENRMIVQKYPDLLAGMLFHQLQKILNSEP